VAEGDDLREVGLKSVAFCTILAVPLLAAACAKAPGNSGSANVAASTNDSAAPAPVNAATASASSANSAPAPGPLSAYVGKTTADPVGGIAFVDRPEVRSAVEALVSDAGTRRWILNRDTTQSPIEMRGTKLYSSACEPHNCGPHQWTISIAPDGSGAEICYHDDSRDSAHSLWYVPGGPVETRRGYCVPT
jgi:hypothetical protein